MVEAERVFYKEITALFRRCFPYIVRDDETLYNIVAHKGNQYVEKRNAQGELMGISVMNENTILLLCVDKEYRRQGIGSFLLEETEEIIAKNGYKEAKAGVGFDYLMPGVPTSKRYFPSVNEQLYEGVDEHASDFFENRGYVHQKDCNIFDMRFSLDKFCREEHSVGDTIEGITYRFATPQDREAVWKCTDDALKEFTQWYQSDYLYASEKVPKVLIATQGDEVCGALLVEVADEESGLGTVGCTSVRQACRGRKIATNMVTLGTKYLRDIGMKEAYLSYTYSGLDHMYGYAGYRICVYFMMARKTL